MTASSVWNGCRSGCGPRADQTRSTAGRRPQAYRELLQARDAVVHLAQRHRLGQCQTWETADQGANGDLALHFRQVRTKAVVDAVPEGQCVTIVAVDVERAR